MVKGRHANVSTVFMGQGPRFYKLPRVQKNCDLQILFKDSICITYVVFLPKMFNLNLRGNYRQIQIEGLSAKQIRKGKKGWSAIKCYINVKFPEL